MKPSTNSENSSPANKQPASVMNRRQMLKLLGLSGGAVLGLGALGALSPQRARGMVYVEAYPTSPLILNPFSEALPVPAPYKPLTSTELYNRWDVMPQQNQSDCDGGYHCIWPNRTTAEGLYLPPPLIYDIKLQVAEHSITSSRVRPIDRLGNQVTPPAGAPVTLDADGTTSLPPSTIFGFNGTFPGPMIYARYGQPVLIRFQNYLADDHGLDCGGFGDPSRHFLTHLHNAHSPPESDGNPNHKEHGYGPNETNAYYCGDWCDNLYLNYPAGGDSREMQSFLWFHDHTHGHTGANVYKGMVGLYPIYDPKNDPGDERLGYKLPGVAKFRSGRISAGIDYNQRIEYDVPLAFYDCCMDDGITPHKDAHVGLGETHPEWWGKSFFKHFPNHGFVGDIFTVNGKAFPVLEVKRRRYRLRMLGASVARCYNFKLVSGRPNGGDVVAHPGVQGQYQLHRSDGQIGGEQCMIMTQIATDGGLLPHPIIRDSVEIWPGKRREVIVDFSKYMDGTPTTKGDVIYLVNTMYMEDGRKPEIPGQDTLTPYCVPVLKIVIGDDAPDNSIDPLDYTKKVNGKATLRMVTNPLTGLPTPALKMRELAPLPRNFKGVPIRTFRLERSNTYGGEIEWLINGHAFDSSDPNGMFPQALPKLNRPELWVVSTSGGWTHPMHMHAEEHRVISRKGGRADRLQVDDNSREDVVALDPGEEVMIYRNFRTFKGKYVAHCHNLAHEDHSMMFGFEVT